MYPKVFQVIRQGTPAVVPLRTADISFRDAILSAMLFHAALFSLLRRNLAIWTHSTACLRSCSDEFIGVSPCRSFRRNPRSPKNSQQHRSSPGYLMQCR